jgi:hypothetical protein
MKNYTEFRIYLVHVTSRMFEHFNLKLHLLYFSATLHFC